MNVINKLGEKLSLKKVKVTECFLSFSAETAPSYGAIWDDFNEQH